MSWLTPELKKQVDADVRKERNDEYNEMYHEYDEYEEEMEDER